MKKIITKALPMLLILCLTVVMVGCGNKAANPATPNNDKPAASKPGDQPVTAEKTLWTQIKEKGVITVGNSPDYEPYEFEDGKGNVIGFDIDLLDLICKELGIKYELVNMNFDNIVIGVQNGQLNMGMSGLSITPDRAKQVDFTTPYLSSAQAVVVNPDSTIKTLADLTGKKITAGMGTTGETAAKENVKDANVIGLDNYAAAFMQLKNKGCDATVADLPVAQKYAAKDGFLLLPDYLSVEENAIAIQKGNEDLVKVINDALAKLQKAGKIDELRAKWMPSPEAQ